MSDEAFVISCERCGKELYQGDNPPVEALMTSVPILCANCEGDEVALEEWEESLEERFLADQYDQYIRALGEI